MLAYEEQQPSFIDYKEIGSTLHEAAVDVVKTEEVNVVNRWYHSELNADFFVWVDQGGQIIKQQFFVHGQVVEWSIAEGIKTGYIVEAEEGDGLDVQESLIYDSMLQETAVKQSLLALEAFQAEDEPFKKQIIGNFESKVEVQSSLFKRFLGLLASLFVR